MSSIIERNTRYNGFPILVFRYSQEGYPDWHCAYIGIPKYGEHAPTYPVKLKKISTKDGRVVSYHEPHAPFMEGASEYDYIGFEWFEKDTNPQYCFDECIRIINNIEAGEYT